MSGRRIGWGICRFSYTARMTTAQPIQRLNVATFARNHARLAGALPLADLPRLAHEASTSVGDASANWSVQGELRTDAGADGQAWLHLQAQALLPMTCQRCMGGVAIALEVDRSYRFVADEDTAMAQDDEADEDVLVLDTQFDLQGLIEDELLMALPLVPRHEECPTPVMLQAADPEFDESQDAKPNPFAVLQTLKSDKGN